MDEIRASRAIARSSGPISASSRSVSIMSMKAAVIVRCSGSVFWSMTCARAATGMHDAMSMWLTSPTSPARAAWTSGGPASRIASCLRGPRSSAGSRAARVGEMPISPASAIVSMSSVSDIAGPAISSSRWTLPVMKKWNVPVPIPPTSAGRGSRPRVEVARPGRSCAASPTPRGMRAAHDPGPSNSSSRASPPHLSSPAPQS